MPAFPWGCGGSGLRLNRHSSRPSITIVKIEWFQATPLLRALYKPEPLREIFLGSSKTDIGSPKRYPAPLLLWSLITIHMDVDFHLKQGYDDV